MDEIDRAQQREEQDRARAIQAARVVESLPAIGVCYWCESPVAGSHRFCDADCRTDYDRAKEARRREGGAAWK